MDGLEKMLEYRLLIGIIFLDLASGTRAHLNSKFTYEKLFSVRQIIVIINEVYKQIYSFVLINDKGDSITKHRNNSFWYKDIGSVVKDSLPKLTTEYEFLTEKLKSYFDKNFSEIKEQRSLSVHYDKEASKVYDMIFELNVDIIFRKMSPFLEIRTGMFNVFSSIGFARNNIGGSHINVSNSRWENNIYRFIKSNFQLNIFNRIIIDFVKLDPDNVRNDPEDRRPETESIRRLPEGFRYKPEDRRQ